MPKTFVVHVSPALTGIASVNGSSRYNFARAQRRIVQILCEQFNQMAQRVQWAIKYEPPAIFVFLGPAETAVA
jgi:hypothetical protein